MKQHEFYTMEEFRKLSGVLVPESNGLKGRPLVNFFPQIDKMLLEKYGMECIEDSLVYNIVDNKKYLAFLLEFG